MYISELMKISICPICNQEVQVTEQLFPSSVEKGKSYTYLHFPCCDYYKQDPFLSEEEMSTLYEKDYAAFNQKGIFKLLMKMVTKKRVKKFRHLIKDKDVLEIGSGTGEFLYHCKSHKPKSVRGVEISEYASAIAKEKYDVNISCSTIENFKAEKKYDVIFMFHVIEHVKEPQIVIDKCRTLLKEGGVLIMETPNCASFERKFYREYWAGWSVPFHTFIFSPKALTEILNRCGLKVNAVHYAAFSNTYSSLIPFLSRHRNLMLLPFLATQFVIKTIMAPLYRQSGTITIEAKIPSLSSCNDPNSYLLKIRKKI